MTRDQITGIISKAVADGSLDSEIVDVVLRDWDTFLQLARPTQSTIAAPDHGFRASCAG